MTEENDPPAPAGTAYVGLDGIRRVSDGLPRCHAPDRNVRGLWCGHALPCPWHPAGEVKR